MTNIAWDYTEFAKTYDMRADYAPNTVTVMQGAVPDYPLTDAVDLGAGTGKLSKLLVARDLRVTAVEPNAAMMDFGRDNLAYLSRSIDWRMGTAEATDLDAGSFDLACFGSSFNVVDAVRALRESARLLRRAGVLAILWNHRDLGDPLQVEIEHRIRSLLPKFEYGSRRANPSGQVLESKLFEPVAEILLSHIHSAKTQDWLSAWHSHATLARQAGALLPQVIKAIEEVVGPQQTVHIPYRTHIWMYRKCQRL